MNLLQLFRVLANEMRGFLDWLNGDDRFDWDDEFEDWILDMQDDLAPSGVPAHQPTSLWRL